MVIGFAEAKPVSQPAGPSVFLSASQSECQTSDDSTWLPRSRLSCKRRQQQQLTNNHDMIAADHIVTATAATASATADVIHIHIQQHVPISLESSNQKTDKQSRCILFD